jgi:DNA-binding NarL/FixJ family response regulator
MAEERDGTSRPIRILIADDHSVLRMGLRMLLEAEPDMEVVGEAGEGEEALVLAEEHSPDILLLDLTMPGKGGLDVLGEVSTRCPDTRVLVLTMHDDSSYLREALAAGAAGYVLKRAADIELITAIRAVYRGGSYLHPDHMRGLLGGDGEPSQRERQQAEAGLSPRELEVLRLVALGYTNRQAADEMGLSVKTVETYRSRLMTKLEMSSRAELVRYALERGMLEDE